MPRSNVTMRDPAPKPLARTSRMTSASTDMTTLSGRRARLSFPNATGIDKITRSIQGLFVVTIPTTIVEALTSLLSRFATWRSIPLRAAGIGPIDDATVTMRQVGDFGHFRCTQRKIENSGIFRQPLFFAGARNYNDVLLHQKSQTDLGRGFTALGADARQYLVVAGGAARNRTISDHRHVVPAACGDHLGLVQERMTFDLVADQGFARQSHGLFDEFNCEIRNADMACQAVALDLAERAERAAEWNLRIGPMQQQQVHFAQAQPRKAVTRGTFEIARREMRRPDFRRYENIAALDARRVQSFADLPLIVVHFRRVDVTIAEPQRLFDEASTSAPAQLPSAQTQERDSDAIGGNIRAGRRALLRVHQSRFQSYLGACGGLTIRESGRFADLRHFHLAQLEIEAAEVFRKPLAFRRTRDRNDGLLLEEAQRHLRRRFAMRAADPLQRRVGGHLAARQRTIADDRHTVTTRRRDYFGLIEVGMSLDLQNGDWFARQFYGLIDHGDVEIGDTDIFGEAGFLHLAERGDRVFKRHLRIRPMDHQ